MQTNLKMVKTRMFFLKKMDLTILNLVLLIIHFMKKTQWKNWILLKTDKMKFKAKPHQVIWRKQLKEDLVSKHVQLQ